MSNANEMIIAILREALKLRYDEQDPNAAVQLASFIESAKALRSTPSPTPIPHMPECLTPAHLETLDFLRLILPMAKGYAHAHQVGDNQGKVNAAVEHLEALDKRLHPQVGS